MLLITVDGLGADRFNELLAAGDLPHIQKHLIDGGVTVRRAVAPLPTITYASLASILTGRHTGSHGIVGNKWFDRYSLIYRDYTTASTYRMVGDDYQAGTLFELIHPAKSASIQCANRRGASRTIDNWASSGVRWFVGKLRSIDRLVPRRMEVVCESANAWSIWPAFIHAYMPAVDETGHRFGSESPDYRKAVINADRQIGRLWQAVQDAGMIERTCFILVSDHGHISSPPDRFFDLADYLSQTGWTVQEHPTSIANFARRQRHYDSIDAVVVNGGDRRVVAHLAGPTGWHERPDYATVKTLVEPAEADGQSILAQPAVQFAIAPRREPESGQSTVEVYSPAGHSRLRRRCVGDQPEYAYEVVTSDALEGALPTGWYDAETWLSLTVDGPYPDFVVPLVELFESPRAGDLMLTANPGWDFTAGGRSGHGGVDAGEVLVPMVISGPGIPAGETIDHARLIDVAPTILRLISNGATDADGQRFDGVDRTDEIRRAGET